jgi:hypothetical protein
MRSLVVTVFEYGSGTQSLALDQKCVSGMSSVQNHDIKYSSHDPNDCLEIELSSRNIFFWFGAVADDDFGWLRALYHKIVLPCCERLFLVVMPCNSQLHCCLNSCTHTNIFRVFCFY